MTKIKKIALFSVLSATALSPIGFVLSCSNNKPTEPKIIKLEKMNIFFPNVVNKTLQVEVTGENLPTDPSQISILLNNKPLTPLWFSTSDKQNATYFDIPFDYDYHQKPLVFQIKDEPSNQITQIINFEDMTNLDPEHPTTFYPKLTQAVIEETEDEKALLKISGEDLPFDIYQRLNFEGPEGLQKADWTLKYFNYDQIILEQAFNYKRFDQKFTISIQNTDSLVIVNYPRSTRATSLESLNILDYDTQNVNLELKGVNLPVENQDYQLLINDQTYDQINVTSSSFDTFRFSLNFDPVLTNSSIKLIVKDKYTQETLSIDANQKYPITPASIVSMEVLDVPLLHTIDRSGNNYNPDKTLRQLLIKGDQFSDRISDFNFIYEDQDITNNNQYKISVLKDKDGQNMFRIDYLINYNTYPSLDKWKITLKGKESDITYPSLTSKYSYENDTFSIDGNWLNFKIKNFKNLINDQNELIIPDYVDFDGFSIPVQKLEYDLITNLKWQGDLPKPAEGEYNVSASQTYQLPFSKIILPETIYSVSNYFFNTRNSYWEEIDGIGYSFNIDWDYSNVELVLPEKNNIYQLNISNLFNGGSSKSFKQITQQNKDVIQFSKNTFHLDLTGSNISKIDISQMSSSAQIVLANSKIEAIDLPNSWTNIPDSMFKNTNLSSITLPQQLETIGSYAFYGTKISSIVLPSKLKTINDYAFANTKITSLKIPASVISIGESAFNQVPIANLTFEANSNLETIKSYAFYDNQITQLNLPSKLKTIGTSAFYSNEISSLTLPSSLITIGASAFGYNQISGPIVVPELVSSIGNYAFQGNKITQLTLPDNLTEIGSYAFNSNSINKVKLPSKLTELNSYVFATNKLTSINLTNIQSIGSNALYNNELAQVTIPEAITEIPSYAFASNKITTLNLHDKITTIGNYAFSSNNELGKKLTKLPDSIIKIGDNAFANCGFTQITLPSKLEYFSGFNSNNLTSITLPETITTIGTSALAYNINISSIDIPESVTAIMPNAFQNLKISEVTLPSKLEYLAGFNGTSISTIEIPESVTTIGDSAFANTKISQIELPSKLKTIEQSAFEKTSITTIQFPDTLTTIDTSAFKDTKLVSIENWPSNLQKIGQDAFRGTLITDETIPSLPSSLSYLSGFQGTNITKIPSIPNSVTTIGSSAFQNTKISSAHIPSNISKLEYRAFADNALLTSVTFDPNSKITSLPGYCFSNNKLLKSIVIPDSVTIIEGGCFSDTPISSINWPSNLTTIYSGAFENTNLSGEITLPKTIKYVYSSPPFKNTLITKMNVPKTLSSTYINNLFPKNEKGQPINRNGEVVEIVKY